MLSFTEENYLKAIYKIHERTKAAASTNAIAEIMDTTAASVTDMMRKLSAKEMIQYEKYKGSRLTAQGAVVRNILNKTPQTMGNFLSRQAELLLGRSTRISRTTGTYQI